MKKKIFVIFFLFTIIITAQEESDVQQAAVHATNPIAFVTKLQFQPNYTLKDNGGDELVRHLPKTYRCLLVGNML